MEEKLYTIELRGFIEVYAESYEDAMEKYYMVDVRELDGIDIISVKED